MAKKPYEFDTRFSDVEQDLQARKNRVKPISFKVCSRCGETKLLFKFATERRNSDGKMAICKSCRIIEARLYYYENRERILARYKIYRATHLRERKTYFRIYQEKNREKLSKLASEWYQKNKEAIKKRNLKYYEENREACNQRRKLWIENNKEKIREYNREYKKLRK